MREGTDLSMAVRHSPPADGCRPARGWTIMPPRGVILAKESGDVVEW